MATTVEDRPTEPEAAPAVELHDDGDGDGTELLPAIPARGDEARRRTRRFWLLLLLPLVVGGFVRGVVGTTDDVPTNDATAYLRSGYSILDDEGFRREGAPELHFPPAAPVILAGSANLFGDPLTGLVVATAAFGTALLVPLSLIARRIGGDRAGLMAAWVAALTPALTSLVVNAGGGSENPYLFFVLLALLSVLNAADAATRGRRALFAAGGGLALGLAYLTRPEAFSFVAVLGPLLVLGALGGWRAIFRRTLRPQGVREAALVTGAFLLALMVCMAPYLSYLHSHTGRWEVTAKSRDASLEAWRAVAEHDRKTRDEVLYELDDTGFQFVAGRETLPTLAKEDFDGYLGIVGVNLRQLQSDALDWGFRPYITWTLIPSVLLAIGAWAAWRNRRSRAVWGVLGIGALCTATAIVFFVQPRYLIPASAMVAILGGVGLAQLRRWWAWIGVPLAFVLLTLSLAGSLKGPTGYFHPREPEEHRIAGEWLEANTDPDDRVMTRSMVVGFYADRRTVAMPYSTLDEMLAFARHHGVRYIVADEYQLRSLRPQFGRMFSDLDIPGLKYETQFVTDGRITRIYSLDPVPKRGSPDAPGVGFVGDEAGG
jgi:4-amino-4-deoxy-L-arabinose transferase-like glycosyltransferase